MRNSDYLKDLYHQLKREVQVKKIKPLLSQEIREKTEYAPKYQRNYIWNDTKAVKLIETILINGEVPPLTVVITDGIYEIIDGRQRYETILRFQNNEFSLKAAHLKKLKELDGLTFSQLPPNVRKIFEEYKIKMITYTPERGVSLEWKDIEKIKRDLFRKYNYGMTALSKSEVARAKYLYDDLTNKICDYLIEHPEQYENYVSLLLPPSKQNLDEREKMNVLLMNVRELLSMPYIPIIGVKTVLTGSAAIEKYYERFVIKCDLTDKRDEFIKIMDKVYTIRERLARNQNPLQKNILFLKSLYWMLSILYQKFPSSFYHFEIDPFCHYIESRDNALDYFNYYKNISSDHIVNRHTYLKNYLEKELKLDVEDYLKGIIENRKSVVYKPPHKLKNDVDWDGIGKTKQLLTLDDVYTVEEIVELIKENRFVVRPIYQRAEVRSIDKASKIIESMILGVKLPPIYVTVRREENGLDTFTVIDGQQRLISILRYIGEEITDENYDFIKTYKRNYALSGLKDLSYLNGKTFEGENALPPSLKELITKYEINVIRIDEQANPDFDPVDMFLRLNESPCTIGKNTFEMWNSFDITQTIDEIKEIAKYDLWKQLGNNMKEEELVTVLAYMDYKKVNIENCSKFFRIHLYTENRDQVDERIEFKMSINNKGEITHFLEMLVPGSKEENIFLECLEEVKRFVNKMKILSDGDSSQLIRIFNPYLSVARRGSMKDFYVMWLLFQTIDNHVIKTYRLQLLDDLERIFKLMKKMPKGKAEDFFMDNMIAFIEKCQEHAVAV